MLIESRLEKFLTFLDNNSSCRFRENILRNELPELFKEIEDFTFNIKDLPFKNKVWHWVNDEPDYNLCKYCNTNKTNMYNNWLDGYRKYCSAKCRANCPNVRQKTIDRCLEIYKVDNIAKYEPTKLKTEETNIRIYGYKSTFQNSEVREKWRNNYLLNNGIDHPSKDKNRAINNFIKASDTYKSKTGYITPFNNPSVSESIKRGKNELLFGVYNERLNNIEYKLQSYNSSVLIIKHLRCENIFEINSANFRYRELNDLCFCTSCYPILENVSIKEREISDYVKSLGYDVINNNRIILNSKELDIFIPSINVAIEYNGLYYHNISNTEKYYHFNKSLECFKQGICLITIWEGGVDYDYLTNVISSEPITIVSDTIYDFNKPYRFFKQDDINIKTIEPSIVEKISNNSYQVYDCGGLYIC